MSQEIINTGTLPNDGEGDPLRVAFQKVNNNFSNLFATSFSQEEATTVGLTPGQVIYTTTANTFTQGTFVIRSYDPGTPNFQNITISAAITANSDDVRFSAYGTTFVGSPLCSYNMDVTSGNVRITVTPIVNDVLQHYVVYQATNGNLVG